MCTCAIFTDACVFTDVIVSAGRFSVKRRTRMRIESIVDEYLASKQNRITSNTYEWYDIQLKKFVEWCHEHQITELSQITPVLVNQFVADC